MDKEKESWTIGRGQNKNKYVMVGSLAMFANKNMKITGIVIHLKKHLFHCEIKFRKCEESYKSNIRI